MLNSNVIILPVLATVVGFTCGPDESDSYIIVDSEVRVSVDVPLAIDGLNGLSLALTPSTNCDGMFEDDASDATPHADELPLSAFVFADGSTVADGPNDYESGFAEHTYIDVVPGCYDLVATPMIDEDVPQPLTCTTPAFSFRVASGDSLVFDLPMLCNEAARPLAEAQTLNSPPELDPLSVEPQGSACELVTVCATARDADGDAVEFEWLQPAALNQEGSGGWPTIVSHTIAEDHAITQCIAVQAKVSGTHDLHVNVYDVVEDPTLGNTPVRAEDLLGEDSHASGVASLDASLGCGPAGRSALILMTLDNQPGIPAEDASVLIDSTVSWAAELDDPAILVVLDDNHRGEDMLDGEFVHAQLKELGYAAEYIVEPSEGLESGELSGYDLVWFVNPGHAMDDIETHRSLLRFRGQGGALVLQGDDITRFQGNNQFMQPLTYLHWAGNGTVACDASTDNNNGESYKVYFDEELASAHPLSERLADKTFSYGNDIDMTRTLGGGEQVLAWASYETRSCVVRTPAIVALDPDLMVPWTEL